MGIDYRYALRTALCTCALALASQPLVSVRADASGESPSPWGVSSSAELSRSPETWLPEMIELGVKAVRGFDQDRSKATLAPYLDAVRLSGLLMWSEKEPLSFPVDNLAGYRAFVTAMLERYKGSIEYWEVWNEPPNFTAQGSPKLYAQIVATAYDAVKAVDPNAHVGIAAKSVHLKYLEEAIRSGARNKFDYVTLHPYESAAQLVHGWDLSFLHIVDGVREMLAQVAPEQVDVPIWFTEVGLDPDIPGQQVDEAQQADVLVKVYTMSLAQGVEQVHWFDPRDSEGRRMGLLRGNGTRKPAYKALAALIAALGAKPRFLGYVTPAPQTLGFLFDGADQLTLIMWSSDGATHKLPSLDKATITWPSSSGAKSLVATPRPTLVRLDAGSGAAKSWRQQAVKKPPAFWHHFFAADAVRFIVGARREGIHLIGGVNAKRMAGRSELDLAGTSGAAFAVDPSFLHFKRSGRPVQIELVVRGHGKGDPGFNLKYESARPTSEVNENGMVGTEHWNSVRGTAPTTFTWTVNDLQFAGKYGSNLAVECDSPAYCDFGIISLTVRQL